MSPASWWRTSSPARDRAVTDLDRLRALQREPHFGRLFGTRLVSQAADGLFQAALAGAVFFNPQHASGARQAAAGFTVLLLPYSLVGPFAGVLLDRWRRQRVLVVANVVRAVLVGVTAALLVGLGSTSVAFFVAALTAMSVNRFYLSALGAALPHVVRPDLLVLANSVTTTLGFAATVAGGAAGLAVRGVLHSGGGGGGYAAVAVLGGLTYLASSVVATGFPNAELLGPDVRSVRVPLPVAARVVVAGLAAGARHLWQRPRATYALAAIGVHRFFYGIATVAILLLYRNYFHGGGLFPAGVAGLAQVLIFGALGVGAGAVATPAITRRIGTERWIAWALVIAGVGGMGLAARYTRPALVAAGLFIGLSAQAVKICVDTIVQQEIAETARGRVFSFYDTIYNLMFIAAAIVGAFVLPSTGRSYAVLGSLAVGYVAAAFAYRVVSGRTPPAARITPVE